MGLAEDDKVTQAFAAERADQPLRMPLLSRLPWGRWMTMDAHGRKTPGGRVAVGPLAIPD